MNEGDTKLKVNLNGRDVTIDVIDIINSDEYQKEYVFYSIEDLKNDQVFVSILNEKEDSYSLDTIENEEEFAYVNKLMEDMTLDFEDEESEQ